MAWLASVLAAVAVAGCATVAAPAPSLPGSGPLAGMPAPEAAGGATGLPATPGAPASAPGPANTPAPATASAGAPGAISSPAPAPAASQPAPQTAAAAAAHGHAQEIATIRRHHLQRLDDKLNIAPQVLIDSCRFESDISTRPPQKRVALTFDDGPEPGQTEQILAVLARYNITAAFFMIGEKMQRHPELVARVRDAHHQIVGNHSWNHPNFHEITPAVQADEVLRDEALLGPSAEGAQKLFRYPFGNSSCETNALVHERGYRIVGWHIDSCDWAFEKTGAVDFQEATSCGVLPQYRSDYVGHVVSAVRARNGGIVLMHEIHPNTVAKLEEVVRQILAEGYTFGTVLDEDFAPSLR